GAAAQPLLPKLWAAERVRDLETEGLSGRRADRMKERIVELGVKYGIATQFTSFVAIETRTGDRRASGYPDTRLIPLSAPAPPAPAARGGDGRGRGAPRGGPPPRTGGGAGRKMRRGRPAPPPMGMPAAPGAPPPRGTMLGLPAQAAPSKGFLGKVMDRLRAPAPAAESATKSGAYDPIAALLLTQRASGLWGPDGNDELAAAATAEALVQLLRAGITTSHPVYAAQIKKAIDAARELARAVAAKTPALAELLVAAAWLLADGKRLRRDIAKQLATPPDEKRLRARVDELAAAL